MATHSSILAWRIPWTEEPGGLQSMGSQSQVMTEQLAHNTQIWYKFVDCHLQIRGHSSDIMGAYVHLCRSKWAQDMLILTSLVIIFTVVKDRAFRARFP